MTKRSNPTDEVVAYFTGRIPAEWFTSAPDITVDQEEILVVGPLADPAAELPDAATASDAAKAEVRRARVLRYREETREARIDIARDAEHRFDRKVAWGVRIADDVLTFTTMSVPVMTRLRMPEREVLDTLVAAGVARSRSEALAWCVRLVGQHEGDWINELKSALEHVQQARAQGPDL